MTDFKCPICGTDFNDDEYRVAERLSSWGYIHLDIWVKCPKCKYTPCFGKELSDTKPIHWRPDKLPAWFKQAIVKAFAKHIPSGVCPFCNKDMELHKVWIHTWKRIKEYSVEDKEVVTSDAPEDIREAFQFLVQSSKSSKENPAVGNYFIPSGIMGQFKCTNWRCKYVRYSTL